MQAIIKKWYDYLQDGKIMGLKCQECGDIQFPPVPVCKECSGYEMEWVEMSCEGELYTINLNAMGIYPYNNTPSVSGYIKLKEGMFFVAILDGVSPADQEDLIKRIQNGPVKVQLFVKGLNEKYVYPHARLV